MVSLTKVVHASERSTVPEISIVAVNSAIPAANMINVPPSSGKIYMYLDHCTYKS